MSTSPPFAATWLRQRRDGALAVALVEHTELRALNGAEALGLSETLLAAVPVSGLPEHRRIWSGLVEQQRLFMRARR